MNGAARHELTTLAKNYQIIEWVITILEEITKWGDNYNATPEI